ncbi:MAG: lysine--tRNA ligase [Candidatus Brocadiia bacterium]
MTQTPDSDRQTKLDALIAAGVSPYGSRLSDIAEIARVRSSFESLEGKEIRVAGRIAALRDHGKSKFFDIIDATGRIQCYVRKQDIGDAPFDQFAFIEVGDIVGVDGKVGKTRLGEITVFASSYRLLAKALRHLPEKWHGLRDVEIKYRRRYLDLIANRDSFEVFRQRSMIVSEFRRYFEEKGFLEVETPMMQSIPGGASAKPFVTHHNTLDIDLYMRIAPELFLKRLLVGGMEKVFEIARCFRNEGIDTRHNPEFTMAEVYEAYADYNVMMEHCEAVVSRICERVLGKFEIEYAGRVINFRPPWRRARFIDLVAEASGIDPWDTEAAKKRLIGAGFKAEDMPKEHDFVLQGLFELLVEPNLVQPTFVLDHPAATTPLCRPLPSDPRLVERFELFVSGMELCNAYTELNDPCIQRKNFNDQIARGSEETIGRIDEDYVRALEHGMPPAGGMGLGIDRLVMLLTGRSSIRDVVLFPLLRPKSEDEVQAEESAVEGQPEQETK